MKEFVNKIVSGDCIDLLGKADEPFADLVFADPPFNIGYKYDRYHDKLKSEQYISWTRDWMRGCCSVLKDNGSFYVAIGDDYAPHVKIIGDELGLTMRNWIIWHYTFGQQTKAKFARSHTHIFYFIKNKDDYKFNDFAVRVPSDRQLIYNDKRANSKGKMPDDVWNEYSRVCGTFKERVKWHPCQMPESLLTRIITVSSDKGDVVLDPFIGSGTTAATAMKLGRKYCGIDISADYAKNTRKRLADIEKEIAAAEKDSGHLKCDERLQLKQLCGDVGIEIKEILGSKKLLDIFTRQFAIRMNNGKEYSRDDIALGLMDCL